MIFTPALARLIERGKKTQHRRVIVPGEPCPLRVGKNYAVQPGAGREARCRLLVTDIAPAPLLALTQRDAIAEGFKTRAQFADHWMRATHPTWRRAREDIVLGQDEDFVLGLFTEHCDLNVWVITFHLDTSEHLTLLRGRMGSISDYTENTHQAAAGEPEAVSAGTLTRITAAAHDRDQLLRADATIAERRSIEESINRLEGVAPNEQVRSRLRTMRKQLEAIDRLLKAA